MLGRLIEKTLQYNREADVASANRGCKGESHGEDDAFARESESAKILNQCRGGWGGNGGRSAAGHCRCARGASECGATDRRPVRNTAFDRLGGCGNRIAERTRRVRGQARVGLHG